MSLFQVGSLFFFFWYFRVCVCLCVRARAHAHACSSIHTNIHKYNILSQEFQLCIGQPPSPRQLLVIFFKWNLEKICPSFISMPTDIAVILVLFMPSFLRETVSQQTFWCSGSFDLSSLLLGCSMSYLCRSCDLDVSVGSGLLNICWYFLSGIFSQWRERWLTHIYMLLSLLVNVAEILLIENFVEHYRYSPLL